ncbi:MAG: site-specific integrase [Nocardioidaceae bacterium]
MIDETGQTSSDGRGTIRQRNRRGDGAIYWDRSKGKYVGAISLGYDVSGTRRRTKVYGRSEEEVREQFRQLRNEIANGVKTPARYTVTDAVEDWLARGLKGRSAKTIEKNTILARQHLIPGLGRIKLKGLTVDQVEELLDTKASDLSTSTLRTCLSILRRSIRNAQRRDLITRNVAELATVPDGREGRPSNALSLEEAHAVLDAARDSPIYAYVVLSLITGMRTEEARAMTWDRVHLDNDGGLPPHVEVWRSVRQGGDTKTKKSRRTLMLPPLAVDALRTHASAQAERRREAGPAWHDNDLVFCTRRGTPLDAGNVRRTFRRVTKAAGLEGTWSPRELRHSFVSLMSASGVPTEAISRLVGHSNTTTTEVVYRRELRPVMTEGAEVMATLFQPQKDT